MAGAQANIRNFIAPLNGLGRTAPSLLEDLTLYDPHYTPQPGQNLLQDPPTHFLQTPELQDLLPLGSCRHDFRTKKRQSLLPALDERPGSTSVYQVAAICLKCRTHLLLKIDFSVAWKDGPCPNHENPLHHLIRSTWRQEAAYRDMEREDPSCMDEVFVYECSSDSCSAIVTVRLSLPILSEEAICILTDPELLRQRTNAAFELKKGHTEGMKRPSSLDVLVDLRAYLQNSWSKDAKGEISFGNKRFAVRFGPEGAACGKVLELLHFSLNPGESWSVPRPDITQEVPLRQPNSVFLDNAESELSALILLFPQEERLAAQEVTTLDKAFPEFSRVLGCQNYDKVRRIRTPEKVPALRRRPYTFLGIPEDASDELIIYAYQKQMAVNRDDPQQNAWLMTALEEIRRYRDSEVLTTQVGIERSMGRYGRETLTEAYMSLGLEVDRQYDDKYIIGLFQSRMHDVALYQEQEMRQNLLMIGEHRQSREIINFAQKSVETYDDALQFLGADANTGDDFIQSLYTTKVSDDATNADMARKSVRFIAEHRNSDQLRAFVETGYQGIIPEVAMDLGDAYHILGIDDRTETDPDFLFGTFNVRVEDDPGNKNRLITAIQTIAKAIQNPILNGHLGISDLDAPMQEISRYEPLGLENIGNTCYLNSLLQWLFTILPLRNVVLDFDEYEMNPSDENISKKKVGHRYIARREVETAQKFARSLANLFREMIISSRTSIRPEIELARLTLETNFIKGGRRSSTLQSGRRPTLGTIDSQPILGPLPESVSIDQPTEDEQVLSPLPIDTVQNQDGQSAGQQEFHLFETGDTHHDMQSNRDHDNSSEATLVSKPSSDDYEHIETISKEQQQAILDNKENLSPVKDDDPPSATSNISSKAIPLAPASPSKINSQAGMLEVQVHGDKKEPTEDKETPVVYAPPPGPPPSLPPRKPAQPSTTALEEYARQQDVQEVMGHAVFQLSCAMRPKGFDKDGGQQDEIHDTFYGESRIYVLKDKPQPEAAQQFLNVQAGIFNEPKDVYAALDNEFDLAEREDGSGAYQSITKLPPVLTISLGRVIFDEKKRAQVKVNHHVDLPTTLYMDRYMDAPEGSVLTERRKQAWEYKIALKKFTERKLQLEKSASMPLPDLFGQLKASLEHLQAAASSDTTLADLIIPQDCIDDAEVLERNLRQELRAINMRINTLQQQIDDSFTDSTFRNLEYKLHAAFFHRGTVGSGHYWVYIFDHDNEMWRKYNDERVTQVQDLREIFADPSKDNNNPNHGNPNANPYFLVYVRAQQLSNGLVETVKREPVEVETEAPPIVNVDQTDIYPLGSDPDEFAGQPSQMTEMPPSNVKQQQTGSPTDLLMLDDTKWETSVQDLDDEELIRFEPANTVEDTTAKVHATDLDQNEASLQPNKLQN